MPINTSSSTRAELLEELRKLGVLTVTAEYSGSGDEGQIEPPEFAPEKVSEATATAVEDLFYKILYDLYAHWEDNEGSFGQFVWDVTADKINLVHNICIETHETEEQTL